MSLFREVVRAWLGVPPPPQPLLWPVHRHDGALYGVTLGGEAEVAVLCFFVAPEIAERFVLEAGLEQHLVGAPMAPLQVVGVCDEMIRTLMEEGPRGAAEPGSGPGEKKDWNAFPYAAVFDGADNPLPLSGRRFKYLPMAAFRDMALGFARG